MRKYLTVIFAALLFFSCTSTEYITLEDRGEKMVLTGQWADTDTTHLLYVGVVDRKGVHPLDDATVSLTINNGTPVPGVLLSSGTLYTSDSDYFGSDEGDASKLTAFVFDCDFAAGDKIKVSAKSATLGASASLVCPAKPIVVSCDTTHTRQIVSLDSEPEERVNVRLKIRDLPSEVNFYRLTLYSRYYLEYLHTMVMEPTWLDYSSEPILGGGGQGGSDSLLGDITGTVNNYCLFDDYSFRDGEYTLRVSYEEWNEDSSYLLYLYTVSFDQFHYLKALDTVSESSFFSEPVSMPSNIEGGLGFISLDAATAIKLK